MTRLRVLMLEDRPSDAKLVQHQLRAAGFELEAHIVDNEQDFTAALAEQFLRSPGRVLSREQLLSRVWGMDFDPGSNVVDVYVRYLRGLLGVHHIITVRGAGYRWE